MKKTKNLKELMDEAGATPYDLAPILGMTPPGVYKAINNENIKPRNFNAIVKAIEEFSRKSLQNDINGNTPNNMEEMQKKIESLERELELAYKTISLLEGQNQVKGKAKFG